MWWTKEQVDSVQSATSSTSVTATTTATKAYETYRVWSVLLLTVIRAEVLTFLAFVAAQHLSLCVDPIMTPWSCPAACHYPCKTHALNEANINVTIYVNIVYDIFRRY